MTSTEIIEEIKRLPLDEQNKVIEFVQTARGGRQLSPEELGQLTRRLVEAKDPAEADRLQEQIVQGFYGGKPDFFGGQRPQLF
jgi:hypothetical protein